MSAQQILMANRSRTPTHDELVEQVNTMARLLVAAGFTDESTASSIGAVSTVLASKVTRTPSPLSVPRTLNVPHMISLTDPSLAIYTIELDVTAGLLNAEEITVTLLVDGTQQAQAHLYTNQLLGLLNVGVNNMTRQVLVAWVPAGALVTIATSGDGTPSLVGQVELVFSG